MFFHVQRVPTTSEAYIPKLSNLSIRIGILCSVPASVNDNAEILVSDNENKVHTRAVQVRSELILTVGEWWRGGGVGREVCEVVPYSAGLHDSGLCQRALPLNHFHPPGVRTRPTDKDDKGRGSSMMGQDKPL